MLLKFMDFLNYLIGKRKVLVDDSERVIVKKLGKFDCVLGPGKHWLAEDQSVHETAKIMVPPPLTDPSRSALRKFNPNLFSEHFELVNTGEEEFKVLTVDGRTFSVIGPNQELVLWSAAGPYQVESYSIAESLEIPPQALNQLTQLSKPAFDLIGQSFDVPEGFCGLVFVDERLVNQLEPGVYHFWRTDVKIRVRLIDLRRIGYDVSGQEILSKDRVTLRVNISADYQVVDPVKAVTVVKDFSEALHRSLQLAFRKTLGAMTLDQLLDEKVSVDAEAAGVVRADMHAIGLKVGDIALKDVILPGEMRDILNQVVTAQKEAEANGIRRREETNATRSLLNTAKVMAENPVMIRLKELEALEKIAGKVERLTITNGTTGLLEDVVKLGSK